MQFLESIGVILYHHSWRVPVQQVNMQHSEPFPGAYCDSNDLDLLVHMVSCYAKQEEEDLALRDFILLTCVNYVA